MNRWIAGAIAGCVATVPMTATMFWLHRRLPTAERYPLPPREITQTVLHDVGLKQAFGPRGLTAVSLAAHFAYGAATGALYHAAVTRRSDSLGHESDIQTARRGAAYGIAVWAASYLGWIPLAGILKPATDHPQRRNRLMLTAHLVWGASTALVARSLSRNAASAGVPPQRRH